MNIYLKIKFTVATQEAEASRDDQVLSGGMAAVQPWGMVEGTGGYPGKRVQRGGRYLSLSGEKSRGVLRKEIYLHK